MSSQRAILTRHEQQQAIAELCRRNFYFFIQEFWEIIIQEPPVWNWHIEYISNILQEYGYRIKRRENKKSDLIINIPPGTTKSTICSVMFPAWLWTIDPTIRILTSSYSSDLSIDLAMKSRDIIQSERFKEYFPNIKIRTDQNNKSYYKNTNTGERYATSTDGTATGKHAHIIIVDDPINPKGAESEAVTTSANNHINRTLSSRKVNKEMTPIILIMQRLSENDPTANQLEKSKVIEHICLPATDDYNVIPSEAMDYYIDGYLDPIRLSQNVLNEAKEDLGSYGYAGQMGQSPKPLGGGILKDIYFPIISTIPTTTNPINLYIDTAYTEKQQNDPSGILITRKIGNDLCIIGYYEVRMEFPELCQEISRLARIYCNEQSKIFIEPKASGISVIQELRKKTGLNVVKYNMPQGDKIGRTNANTAYYEANRVKLLQGAWNAQFLERLTSFPNAKHDEAVDVLNMATTTELVRVNAGRRAYIIN